VFNKKYNYFLHYTTHEIYL